MGEKFPPRTSVAIGFGSPAQDSGVSTAYSSGGCAAEATAWHVASCVRTWTGHSHWISAVAITTDGRRIISSCTDGRIRIWAVDAPICLAEFDLWPAAAEGLLVDGDRIYTASRDGRVYGLP